MGVSWTRGGRDHVITSAQLGAHVRPTCHFEKSSKVQPMLSLKQSQITRNRVTTVSNEVWGRIMYTRVRSKADDKSKKRLSEKPSLNPES